MSYLRYLCLFAYSGVQHIAIKRCVFALFFFVLCASFSGLSLRYSLTFIRYLLYLINCYHLYTYCLMTHVSQCISCFISYKAMEVNNEWFSFDHFSLDIRFHIPHFISEWKV
jgi:hypothetical protein